jgi:hypothetical protein
MIHLAELQDDSIDECESCAMTVRSVESIQTRCDVYRLAIERFASDFPHLKPYAVIGEKMGICECGLRLKINGGRPFTSEEQDTFFRLCNFPKGYVLLSNLTFNIEEGKK